MILIFPEEIKKLEEIYGPYMINCKLKEDAPLLQPLPLL